MPDSNPKRSTRPQSKNAGSDLPAATPLGGSIRVEVSDHRTYCYGVRLDTESLAVAADQLSRAHQLYNTLMRVMRSVYDGLQEYVLQSATPSEQEAFAQAQALKLARLGAARARDDIATRAITEQQRQLWSELAPALAKIRRDNIVTIRQLFLSRIGPNSSTETYAAKTAAVAAGLGWATAADVHERALGAWKSAMAKGKPPRFVGENDRDWERLTMAFPTKGGVSVGQVFNGQVAAFAIGKHAPPGKRNYEPFRMRVGNGEAGVVVQGTAQIHRHPAAEARVPLVRLVRRRVADKFKWELQLPLKLAGDDEALPDLPKPEDAVQLHDREALRFSVVYMGHESAAAIVARGPQPKDCKLVSGFAHPDREQIRAWTDIRRQLLRKLKGAAGSVAIEEPGKEVWKNILALFDGEPIPEERMRRLHRLHARVLSSETPMDLPSAFATWASNDRKLWQQIVGLRRKLRHRLLTYFRLTAANMVRGVNLVAFFPGSPMDNAGDKLAQGSRHGDLALALRWAAAKAGITFVEFAMPSPTSSERPSIALAASTWVELRPYVAQARVQHTRLVAEFRHSRALQAQEKQEKLVAGRWGRKPNA